MKFWTFYGAENLKKSIFYALDRSDIHSPNGGLICNIYGTYFNYFYPFIVQIQLDRKKYIDL